MGIEFDCGDKDQKEDEAQEEIKVPGPEAGRPVEVHVKQTWPPLRYYTEAD